MVVVVKKNSVVQFLDISRGDEPVTPATLAIDKVFVQETAQRTVSNYVKTTKILTNPVRKQENSEAELSDD